MASGAHFPGKTLENSEVFLVSLKRAHPFWEIVTVKIDLVGLVRCFFLHQVRTERRRNHDFRKQTVAAVHEDETHRRAAGVAETALRCGKSRDGSGKGKASHREESGFEEVTSLVHGRQSF